jgi:hypothetical protein
MTFVILSCYVLVVCVEHAVIGMKPVDTQILDASVIVGAGLISFQGQTNYQTERFIRM